MGVQLETAGFDLREVEDVVDDRQQRLAGCVDRLGVVALLVIERRVEEQPAHPDDGVHRRPDLVAHRRQERALRLVRGVGVAPCLLQLDRPLVDPPLERLDVLPELGGHVLERHRERPTSSSDRTPDVASRSPAWTRLAVSARARIGFVTRRATSAIANASSTADRGRRWRSSGPARGPSRTPLPGSSRR